MRLIKHATKHSSILTIIANRKLKIDRRKTQELAISKEDEELKTITDDKKKKIIQSFALFKQVQSICRYLNEIEVRTCSKHDSIYSIGDNANYLYLIVAGEVGLQIKTSLPDMSQSSLSLKTLKKLENQEFMLSTETLGSNNFFGEEEILKNTERVQNAKCLSVNCILLQIPVFRVQHFLFYDEFREYLQKSAEYKSNERQRKINNFITIKSNAEIAEIKRLPPGKSSQTQTFFYRTTFKKMSNQKECIKFDRQLISNRIKIAHGIAIKQHSHIKFKNPERFSMLQTNRELYQTSKRKFRKYSQAQSYSQTKQPKLQLKERSLKTIWKVLNLQNILQEQPKLIGSEQGLKYYDAHVRMRTHMNNVKSYRPKTVSTNCKMKQQYVHYLQNLKIG